MKMFLTSSVNTVAHDIKNYIELSKGNKLVFIDTAAEPEKQDDISWLLNDRKSLVDVGFEVTDYTITAKTSNELRAFLPRFDYIYLSGGHTEHLLSEAYKSGFYSYVKELVYSGKVYIGTSAGSIVTGPDVPLYLKDETAYPDVNDKPAFGFVNFYIVPHWGSNYFKKEYLGGRLHSVYKDHLHPFILLSDHQYIIVDDNSFRIVDLSHSQ